MKKDNKGFTLLEMMMTVAIIGILVSIAMPSFTGILEKSREATDLANVRTAYTQIMMDACVGENPGVVRVKLQQRQPGWQSSEVQRIGDIIHTNGEPENDNWQGTPKSGGMCVVSFSFQKGILFNWNGYPFNTEEKLFDALRASGLLNALKGNKNFEIDSKCPNSSMVPKVMDQLKNNSLLKLGTWAYLGDATQGPEKRYLYWTSVNTNDVGVGKKIPVIVQTGDGRFYISETTTGHRQLKSGEPYVAISEHLSDTGYTNVINKGTQYDSLLDAYDAYVELVKTDPKYEAYKNSLVS